VRWQENPIAPRLASPRLASRFFRHDRRLAPGCGRHLGEGAFAHVDLYQVNREGAAAPLMLAVKVMRRTMPGPLDPVSGVQPMIPVPSTWRANFQARGMVSSERRQGVYRGCCTVAW
jgi:hypothetical protein